MYQQTEYHRYVMQGMARLRPGMLPAAERRNNAWISETYLKAILVSQVADGLGL